MFIKHVQRIYWIIQWDIKQICKTISSTWAVYVKVGVTQHFRMRVTSNTYNASSTHILNNSDIQKRYVTHFRRLERYMLKSAWQSILKRETLAVRSRQVQRIYLIILWDSKQICKTLSSTWAVYLSSTYKASSTYAFTNIMSVKTDM